MNRHSNIGIVIGREYSTRVRKKSFILMTLLSPLLLVLFGFFPFLLAQLSGVQQQNIAIIDKTGLYSQIFEDHDGYKFFPAEKSLAEYRKETGESEDVTAILEIRQDLREDPAAITLYSYKELPSGLASYIRKRLDDYITEQNIQSYTDIPNLEEIMRSVDAHVKIATYKFDGKGSEAVSSSMLASFLGMALTGLNYMFIMMYGAIVMQAVMEEKKSRIIEVMVSSVKPFDLMMGKIIGIGLVGLTQLTLWGVFIALISFGLQYLLLGGLYDAEALSTMNSADFSGLAREMDASDLSEMTEFFGFFSGINFFEIISFFVLFFIGGYLLYSALFAAIGSTVSSEEESSQFMLPVTLLMIFSFYAGMASVENPEGPLALWCSLIPFTSPVVMMVRLPFGVPLWQELLSVFFLYLSFVGLTWVGAKIYRVGILMYGKKPTVRELLRWISYK